MNLILFENKEVKQRHVVLSDHRAKHIVKVLHSELGDSVRIGVIDGDIGVGNIVKIQKKFPFIVELEVQLTEKTAYFPSIDLLLALPRPIMLKRILSQVTALGVGRIFIINASRVEKSFWEAGILQPDEYRPHLIQGLEQAVDTRLPQITTYRHFRSFIEDKLPGIADKYSHRLLAHPNGKQTLSACMGDKKGRVIYAIGPEGGWVDSELDKFEEAGMASFSIGARILKVDTAAVAIHGRIMQELE